VVVRTRARRFLGAGEVRTRARRFLGSSVVRHNTVRNTVPWRMRTAARRFLCSCEVRARARRFLRTGVVRHHTVSGMVEDGTETQSSVRKSCARRNDWWQGHAWSKQVALLHTLPVTHPEPRRFLGLRMVGSEAADGVAPACVILLHTA